MTPDYFDLIERAGLPPSCNQTPVEVLPINRMHLPTNSASAGDPQEHEGEDREDRT